MITEVGLRRIGDYQVYTTTRSVRLADFPKGDAQTRIYGLLYSTDLSN